MTQQQEHETLHLPFDVSADERPRRSSGLLVATLALTVLTLGALFTGFLGYQSAQHANDRAGRLASQLSSQSSVIKGLQGQSDNAGSISSLKTELSTLETAVSDNEAAATKANAGTAASVAALKKRLSTICDNQTVTNQISTWSGAQNASGQTWYSELTAALYAACQPYAGAETGE